MIEALFVSVTLGLSLFQPTATVKGRPYLLPKLETPKIELPPLETKPSPSWGGKVRFVMTQGFPNSFSVCAAGWRAVGRDALVIKALAHHVGSPSCKDVPNMKIFPNGTPMVGGMAELLNGNADVYGVTTYVPPEDIPEATLLYPHVQDDFCLLVRRVGGHRQSVLRSFAGDTWASVAAQLLLFGCALHLAGLRDAPLRVLKAFVTGAFRERRGRPVANALLLLLSLFGIVMVSAFTGCFMSFLSKKQSAVQINTLEMADKKLTRIYAPQGMLQYYKDIESDQVISGLLAKSENITGHTNTYLKMVVESESIALVHSRESLIFLQKFPEAYDNGYSATHIVPQCFWAPAYAGFPVRKNWIFADRFSSLVQIMLQAGIPDKLYRDSWVEAKKLLNYLRLREVKPSDIPHPLTLEQISEPGILLGCGLTMASVVFMTELLLSRKRRQMLPAKQRVARPSLQLLPQQ